MGVDLLLVHVERVRHLRYKDLLHARVHLLLAGREPLLVLADREVADDLGQFVDVAGLDLVAVVLEPPVPVLRHVRALVLEERHDLLQRLLVDHAPQPRDGGVLGRDHHGHVVVEDLDRQVLTTLPEDVLHLLLEHLARPVVRIDDAVADLELDPRQRHDVFEVLK